MNGDLDETRGRSERGSPRPSIGAIVARAFLIGGLVGFAITLLYIALR